MGLLTKLAEADARLTIPELVQEFAEAGVPSAGVNASDGEPEARQAVRASALDIEAGA